MALSEILTTGLNNPECAIFTGMWIGGFMIVKYIFMLFGLMILFKFVDKMAVEPFLEYLKNKVYKKK